MLVDKAGLADLCPSLKVGTRLYIISIVERTLLRRLVIPSIAHPVGEKVRGDISEEPVFVLPYVKAPESVEPVEYQPLGDGPLSVLLQYVGLKAYQIIEGLLKLKGYVRFLVHRCDKK